MEFDQWVMQIRTACDRFNRTEATALSQKLADHIRTDRVAYPATSAVAALKALLRKRWFAPALVLAEAVLESGQDADGVRVRYAQALIDSGRLHAALAFLREQLPGLTPRSFAESEIRGLIGRVYKQMYVNGAGEGELRGDRLMRAYDAYFDVYNENAQMRWHGINAIALHQRALRDRLKFNVEPPSAQRILEEASAHAKGDIWECAIAGEASIALKKNSMAKKWYEKYATSKDADAFEIASSLRQLTEVWQLSTDKKPGSDILPLLHAELLKRQGGGLELQGAEIAAEFQHEKTFGTDAAVSIGWYQLGLKRCFSVCCIRKGSTGDPWGTGFVVRGSDFGRPEPLLVLTNEHVVSATHPSGLRSGDVSVSFEATKHEGLTRGAIVWSDPRVDATLVKFDGVPSDIEPIEVDPYAELPERGESARVYVIGHPRGGRLSFSLNDNLLLDYDKERVHYRAPTEPGSSGSPVFDDQWRLIGLHHGGSREMRCLNGKDDIYEANEGFRIDHICRLPTA